VLHLQIQVAAIGADMLAGTDTEKDSNGDHIANMEMLNIDSRIIGKFAGVIIRHFGVFHAENVVAIFKDLLEKGKAVVLCGELQNVLFFHCVGLLGQLDTIEGSDACVSLKKTCCRALRATGLKQTRKPV